MFLKTISIQPCLICHACHTSFTKQIPFVNVLNVTINIQHQQTHSSSYCLNHPNQHLQTLNQVTIHIAVSTRKRIMSKMHKICLLHICKFSVISLVNLRYYADCQI